MQFDWRERQIVKGRNTFQLFAAEIVDSGEDVFHLCAETVFIVMQGKLKELDSTINVCQITVSGSQRCIKLMP